MKSLQFGLLLVVPFVQSLAHPTRQITLTDGVLAHVLKQHVSAPQNLTFNEVLGTIEDFQRNASSIGRIAAALPAIPGDEVPDKDYDAWFDRFVDLHSQLRNQTANAKSLQERLLNFETVFNVDETVKLMKSLLEVMNNLNKTELDPLVQFSKTKLSSNGLYRRTFTDPRPGIVGGLVNWASAVQGVFQTYPYHFSESDKIPTEIEDAYFEKAHNTSYDLFATVDAVSEGQWFVSGYTQRQHPVSLKESL